MSHCQAMAKTAWEEVGNNNKIVALTAVLRIFYLWYEKGGSWKIKILEKLYIEKKTMSTSTELKPVDQYCYTSVSEYNKREVILIYHRYCI